MYKFLLFIIVFIVNLSVFSKEVDNHISVDDLSILKISELFKSHSISCEQLVNLYLDRIKKYNLTVSNKPPLNAITEINPHIIEQSKYLDEKMRINKKIGRLFCVPILLKDNIDSYDTHSSSGSFALIGNQPNKDASLVKKLRDEDAIILGKTAMDEFASGLYGVSTRNGRVGNAYDTTKNPGGSSSGSAVSLAADFALVTIGTDNSGSVRIPAAFNGVIGLRPSMDLISKDGIFPRGNIDGTAGPMTKSVEDLAIILDIIATKNLMLENPVLKNADLTGRKIGVIHKFSTFDAFHDMPKDAKKLFDEFTVKIQLLRGEVVPKIDLIDFNLDRSFNLSGESEDINQYLSSYPSVRKNYSDICESERSYVHGTKKECLSFIANIPKKNSKKYKKALDIIYKNRLYIEKIMTEKKLDAFLIPVSSYGSATYKSETFFNESIASNAGLPGITFNIGYTKEGMPVGVELIGKKYSEAILLEIAHVYEKNSTKKIKPIMPEANKKISSLSISEYNNLISQIGYRSFSKFLNKDVPEGKSKIILHENFNEIYLNLINENIMK